MGTVLPHFVESSNPALKKIWLQLLLLMLLLCNCAFVKERLDFSCAMFGPSGGLVANGPHVPMHLGSMQETVKYQVCY